jgi:hypothetical protein
VLLPSTSELLTYVPCAAGVLLRHPAGKGRKASPYVAMRSEEGKLGLTLLQRVLQVEEAQQQQQEQQQQQQQQEKKQQKQQQQQQAAGECLSV